ncbi:arylamine N-acetyltransferase [Streptomyces sp. NPDC047002]|uniref:arylamine N-acetyltransferase family protein n=1 Tax=Streptomyces sp. NPDC047002 TaxID=3155475 RepID=UPI00345393CB
MNADRPSPAPASDLLDGYLRRVGLPGAGGLAADAAGLAAVQRAHSYALPFENIDPVRGTVPSLAAADLEAKLVHGGRGGYCYEHNILFADALTALGFGVTLLTARVLVGADTIASRPRTHMALLVRTPEAEGSVPYLADVGFGAPGALIEPLPLVADAEQAAEHRRHRLVRVPHEGPAPLWVLEAHGDGGWARQYAFTCEPFERVDFDGINWNIATNPRSPFSRRLFVQRALPGGVHRALADGRLTETRAGAVVRTADVRTDGALRRVLDEEFGIVPPAGLTLADVRMAAG